MQTGLAGRTAIVTGAASGIGRATCLRLAREASQRGETGQVAAVDLGPSAGMESLIGELRELGAEPLPLYGDMGSTDDPARVVGEAADRFGGLDGLVSNAGINRPGPLVSYSVEDWDRLFAVNTRATFLLAQAAHPTLKTSGGAIAIVGSMSGSNAHAGLGAYAPSKAAVIMLARVLAQEFGPDGIRVNTVSPGMVRTGMTEAVYADAEIAAARDATGDADVARRLVVAHGSAWRDVWAQATQAANGTARVVPGLSYVLGELVFSAGRELACTLGDLLIRRTRIAFETRDHGLSVAPVVTDAVAPVLGWDTRRKEAEIDRFREEVGRIFSVERG